MLLGCLLGIIFSLLSLLPGLHGPTLLLLIAATTELSHVALTCTMVGCTAVLEILRKIKEPVTRESLAFADVATKLAYQGYTHAVIRIHTQAVWAGFSFVLLLGLALLGTALLGHNVLEAVVGLIKPFMAAILAAITLTIVLRSSKPFRTLLVVALATTLGYFTFNGPLKNSSWVMTPLLSGLFMVGNAIALIKVRKPLVVPEEKENQWEVNSETEMKGAIVGTIAGLLAGLGTSSLVALMAPRDEEDYLAVQSAAEAANSMFAILGFVLIGSTRSGAVAAMASKVDALSPYDGLIFLSFILVGILVGQALVWKLTWIPQPRWLIPISLIGTIVGVYHAAGLVGLLVMLTAWQLSSLSKALKVPNQALLAALFGPVMLYYLGIA
jgi:TctA family transporter